MVFPIVVAAINGLRGRIDTGQQSWKGDPGYYRVISLFQEMQASGHTSMRVVKGKQEEETAIIFIYRDILPPDMKASLKELEELSGLRPGGNEFKVTYGILPESDL